MEQITALDFKIKEMAARIRELREIQNLTTAQMIEFFWVYPLSINIKSRTSVNKCFMNIARR